MQLIIRTATTDIQTTQEQYKDILPKRPTFDRDQYILKQFIQYPFLWNILELIADVPQDLVYCIEIIKCLLANIIADWNSEIIPTVRKVANYENTCRLVEILRKGQVVAPPLCYCSIIFEHITPKEITILLMSIWNFIVAYPPSIAEISGDMRQYPTGFEISMDLYLTDLKIILRNNITKTFIYYPIFFKDNT